MAAPSWQISGQYYETCSCDFVCPCITGKMMVRPSKGTCTFSMGFQIERGSYGSVALDGIGFIVIGQTPEEMVKGNWSVGLIVDERASGEQRDAIGAIASGASGGPMSMMSGLIGKFLGMEPAAIRFDPKGLSWSFSAPGFVDIAAEAAMGVNPEATEPLHLDNTGHPANDRVALAHSKKSHVHAFGLTWDDDSGKNAGQYAPFSWKN